jgi:succinate dehydrogenase/fumarate reductase flavoprotein subunit
MVMNLKNLLPMKKDKLILGDYELDYYSVNTLIIGSGAASLNAALSLHLLKQEDIIIATAQWGGGTSNNAGSDKQTYYKLSLAGDEPDSMIKMAEDLYNGKCMHGDIALCEAQGSVAGFMNLVRLGVPFPQNRFGAWVGYKTDHDPKARARATSAGPYTSQKMFEVLASEVKRRKIIILDKLHVISLLTSEENGAGKVIGALAINLKEKDPKKAFVLFNSVNIILGTGGPGGIYESSVYPLSQSGSSGMAYEAGATGQNLTESQFGIASVKFRWNLSGSYQQVIPRYFSTDKNGTDEKEFLNDFFSDITTLTRAIFLKGYQWPFDPRKIADYGSSLIDLLVYRETIYRNRKVFLDYSKNPKGPGEQRFSTKLLDKEVLVYLKNSGALADTPYKRLEAMNKPAIDLYLHHKIDISSEPLEISVCAQHNNGGLKGNIWWESDLKHLFPVGEANGSHGIYRPGGSSLNSGQVGSYRAALFISKHYAQSPPDKEIFLSKVKKQAEKRLYLASVFLNSKERNSNVEPLKEIRHRMSAFGGIMRNRAKIQIAVNEAKSELNFLQRKLSAANVKELSDAFLLMDLCLTHYLYLEAIKIYIEAGGRSRGSFMVTENEGYHPEGIPENDWNFTICRYDREIENVILEIRYKDNSIGKELVKVRPVPDQELWFEKVWKKNLEDNLSDS